MKIICAKCYGSGVITCQTRDNARENYARECMLCAGDGVVSESIEDFLITREMREWEEFTAMKKDAVRVRKDALRLELLVPARAEAYRSQLQAVLVRIEAQASALAKRLRL